MGRNQSGSLDKSDLAGVASSSASNSSASNASTNVAVAATAANSAPASSRFRPKRRATNVHIFRYLQTRNPSRLEEEDLRRALEASLEECPDNFWPEDSASCSSFEQNQLTASSPSSNSSSSRDSLACRRMKPLASRRRLKSLSQGAESLHPAANHYQCNATSQCSHHVHQRHATKKAPPSQQDPHHSTATSCYPLSNVHNRYKPVAKKNIYNEADFFHDGIMEYIEYELTMMDKLRRKSKNSQNTILEY